MLNGIDISYWQRGGDLAAARDGGVEFVIARASYGPSQPDAAYGGFIGQARALGLLCGSYHFATGQAAGWQEADAYLAAADWRAGEVLVLDLEREVETGRGILAMADPVGWALEFLRRCQEKTGVRPLVYMSGGGAREFDWSPVVAEDFGLWVAHWDTDNPIIGPWPFWAVHQTSSSGSYPGFGGRLDTDRFNGDAAAWLRYGTPSGQTAPAAPEPAPAAPAVAAAPVVAGGTYIVQAGDSLSAIGARFGLSWQDLYNANTDGIGGDPNRIYPGQVLTIPGQGTAPAPSSGRRQIDAVEVRSGDNLTAIARRYAQGDVTAGSLAADNGIANPDLIRPGQVLAVLSSQ